MRPNRLLAAFLVLGFTTAPSSAATGRRITVFPGTLADALASLARQGGIDVGGNDPALAAIRVRGFSSAAPIDRALDRLLAPTPFLAERVAGGAFRIVRRPPAPIVRPVSKAVVADETASGDIIVVASKREQTLSSYPGAAVSIRSSDDAFGPIGSEGTHWLLSRTPILQSTELGAGRNKLFIRGIADSSFTGPTQATASTYFGGVRIGYNGPDPNLNLYDIDHVEVLEGPQGTLYGAGSIGGIILLSPHAPALGKAAASAQFGGSLSQHGGAGYDAAAMLNVAPIRDAVAFRFVAYRNREGGYIDATGGQRALNPLTQTGGRAAVRIRPIAGLTIDGSYLAQNSEQPDLQYANPAAGRLARRQALRQPFADHFRLARILVEQRFPGGWTAQIAAGRVDHDTDQRYDATRNAPAPVAYDEAIDIGLTTLEAHVGRTLADGGGYLLGVSSVWDRTSARRTYGSLLAPRDLIGVVNKTREKAIYGEWTLPIGRLTSVTAGARYTSARMDGEPSQDPVNKDFIRGQTTSRLDPELGFVHRFSPKLQWFGQYTQGFRTGGLAVARGIGRVATYRSDHIQVGQTGLRLLRTGTLGVSGYTAIAYARWSDIQADLVGPSGFPYTANVGNGRILTFEGALDWAFRPSLQLSGAVELNRSRLVDPLPDFASSGGRPLPASPGVTGTGRLSWAHAYGDYGARADLHARYVGHSRLGVGSALDIRYGNYVETGITGSVRRGRYDVSLSIDNLFDEVGNRFAIGNPFAVALRNEATPLRPRTVRIGLGATF